VEACREGIKMTKNARKSIQDIVAQTDVSVAIAKDSRERGANFVGPTIICALMQAIGMVNDHLVDCYSHAECADLGGEPHVR
jgi:DNA-3-methyladenine glycosylase I